MKYKVLAIIKTHIMWVLEILLICIILTSCNYKNIVISTLTSDSIHVDSKYGKGTWTTYFKNTKTPLGAILKLKILNDSSYAVLWGNSVTLKSWPDA